MSQKYIDECAIKAMEALLYIEADNGCTSEGIKDIPETAYLIAHKMLKEREEYGKSIKTAARTKKRIQGQEKTGSDT